MYSKIYRQINTITCMLLIVAFFFMAGSSVVNADVINETNEKEKIAINFIKDIYSDFRTVKDADDYDKMIEKEVCNDSVEFKKLLVDRKYIQEKDEKAFNTKVTLVSEKFESPQIVSQTENVVQMVIEAEYLYKEELIDQKQVKAIDDGDFTSGIQVFYEIILKKENNSWKIKEISSNDITSGIMFPDVLTKDYDVYSIKKNTQNVQKENINFDHQSYKNYNVDEIIAQRINDGKLAQSAQKEMSTSENISENAHTNEIIEKAKHGNFHKMKAAPLRKYQDKWWNDRNPAYTNYSGKGGDCTNYASQVLHAGGAPYDKTGSYTWYPDSYSWINVAGIKNYLLNNTYTGPCGKTVSKLSELTCGDLIQIKENHTVVVYKGGTKDPYVTAHSSNYKGRFIKRYGSKNLKRILVKGYYD